MTALLVALGGGVGAALRFLVESFVAARTSGRFPWGVVLVNVTGSFAIGLAVARIEPGTALTVATAGLLGGYTTFSTASLDTARLVLRGRGGRAVAHAAGTAVACVTAAWLGLVLG